ncbi:MAG: hypothetical protein HY471_00570 [Candidatus Sungbacteria bacterium]|nr:hypothetical protein [Candidatus Sungbacteria bacterium]
MNFPAKKLFVIIVIFVVVLAVASFAGFRLITSRLSDKPLENTRGLDAFPAEGLITYTEDGFFPAEVSIAIERGLGCAVRVRNQSSRPLKVGLSPHAAKDPGQDYPMTEPGGTLFFDPRFSGFTELRFHDHEHPNFEFLVKFEKSCQ